MRRCGGASRPTAANEAAVEAFVGGKLSFGGIARAVEKTMQAHAATRLTSADEIEACDRWARERVRSLL